MIYEPSGASPEPSRAATGRALAVGLVAMSLVTGLLLSYALGPYCRDRTGWPCLPGHRAAVDQAATTTPGPAGGASGTSPWPGVPIPTPVIVPATPSAAPFGDAFGDAFGAPPFELATLAPPPTVPLAPPPSPTSARPLLPLPTVSRMVPPADQPSFTLTPRRPATAYAPPATASATAGGSATATPEGGLDGTTTATATPTTTTTPTP